MKNLFSISKTRSQAINVIKDTLPHQILLDFYGVKICLKSNSKKLIDRFRKTHSYFEIVEENKNDYMYITAIVENSFNYEVLTNLLFPNRTLKGNFLILEEYGLIYLISKYSNLVFYVASSVLNHALAKLVNDFFVIHAASVVKGEKGIIFPGSGGCGKTTLVVGLVKQGFRYMSDDIVIIDRKTLEVLCFSRALGIRENTIQLVKGLEYLLNSDPPLVILDEKRWSLDFSEYTGEKFIPQYIIFPKLCFLDEPKLEPISKAKAALNLLKHSPPPFIPANIRTFDSASNFDIAVKLVKHAKCFNLFSGNLDKTIGLILNLE